MRKTFFIWTIIVSTICRGQNKDLEKLVDQTDTYKEQNNYDSLIIVCNKIKSISHKKAKEKNVDYYIAKSYFETKQFSNAIKYSKRYLRKPAMRHLTREGFTMRIYKRYLCYNLYEIYKGQGDSKRALKYLQKIDKKYDNMFCGTGKGWWREDLYKKMIACYTARNDQKHVTIYKKKIEELKN